MTILLWWKNYHRGSTRLIVKQLFTLTLPENLSRKLNCVKIVWWSRSFHDAAKKLPPLRTNGNYGGGCSRGYVLVVLDERTDPENIPPRPLICPHIFTLSKSAKSSKSVTYLEMYNFTDEKLLLFKNGRFTHWFMTLGSDFCLSVIWSTIVSVNRLNKLYARLPSNGKRYGLNINKLIWFVNIQL